MFQKGYAPKASFETSWAGPMTFYVLAADAAEAMVAFMIKVL